MASSFVGRISQEETAGVGGNDVTVEEAKGCGWREGCGFL
jgi:hypothetical protein